MRADLDRRGVGAQHDAAVGRLDEERVLHRARRVVRADVQGIEVEPLGLDLGPVDDVVAHRDEDVRDALHDRRQRVAGTHRVAVVRHRDVDGLLDEDALVPLRSSTTWRSSSARLTCCRACPTRLPASALAAGGSAADLAVGQRQRRAVTRVREPDLLQRIEVAGSGDRGQRRCGGGGDGLLGEGLDLDRVELAVWRGHPASVVSRRVGVEPRSATRIAGAAVTSGGTGVQAHADAAARLRLSARTEDRDGHTGVGERRRWPDPVRGPRCRRPTGSGRSDPR